MKIKVSYEANSLEDLFREPLSDDGEADYLKMLFVEELLNLMKDQGVSRKELARRMNVQPSRITSMLTGANNFTIKTMVNAARAVGASLHQKLVPTEKRLCWQVWEDSGDGGLICLPNPSPLSSHQVTFDIKDSAHGYSFDAA